MKQLIVGSGLSGALVKIYVAGGLVPANVYEEISSINPVNQVYLGSNGVGKFYYEDIEYPFPAYFDLTIEKSGYDSISLYGIWSSFISPSGIQVAGVSPYTLRDMRTRLATFYSLDEDDSQVKAMANECIQTGYEKVVSMVNMHSKQKDLTISSLNGVSEYDAVGLGIPTYVGYKGSRLKYLPYETLREKYNNFGPDWDSGSDDPVYYSLKGYDGEKKKLVIVPSPKVTDESIYILCFQNPGILQNDNDYPLVPQDWAWLVLERAKIERIRFEGDMESYQIQAQEFVAYIKVMLKRLYPAAPEVESGFKLPPEREQYQAWRGRRQQ